MTTHLADPGVAASLGRTSRPPSRPATPRASGSTSSRATTDGPPPRSRGGSASGPIGPSTAPRSTHWIEEGRRVYDNVRKFVLCIFAHAVSEVVPFLLFALSGGLVLLPLTVLQILAIDLGTETLPALALGREPAEPGSWPGRPAHLAATSSTDGC